MGSDGGAAPRLPEAHAEAWRALATPFREDLVNRGFKRIQSSFLELRGELYGQPKDTIYRLPFEWHLRDDGTYVQIAAHVWQAPGAPDATAGHLFFSLRTVLSTEDGITDYWTQDSLPAGKLSIAALGALFERHARGGHGLAAPYRIAIPSDEEEAVRWLRELDDRD
jgi:hypothetical protein